MLVSLVVTLVVSAIIMQITAFSTTLYRHRTATHKALVMHPGLEWTFKFMLWLTTGLLWSLYIPPLSVAVFPQRRQLVMAGVP